MDTQVVRASWDASLRGMHPMMPAAGQVGRTSRGSAGHRRYTGHRRYSRREAGAALVFLAPMLIGLAAFTAIPIGFSVYYTFTKWDLIAESPTWIGLANWKYLLHDQRIPHVLWNTVRFVLIGTTSFLIMSLLAALLVVKPRRGVGLYRAALFMPFVLSQIAIGVVWRWMFNTTSGPINATLHGIGLPSPDWLLDSKTAMASIAIVTTWQGVGYGMTLYLAGLNAIPPQILESATIDGAGPWRRFRHVIFPLISPTTLFLTVTSIIGALQLFDIVVAMTSPDASTARAGGPNDSTRTVVLYLYNQMFQYSERLSGIGYAAAIGWMLAILTFLVTLAQGLLSRRWVFYQGQDRNEAPRT